MIGEVSRVALQVSRSKGCCNIINRLGGVFRAVERSRAPRV